MYEVVLTGWKPQVLRKVSLSTLIREWANIGLGAAKKNVDDLLAGGRIVISFQDEHTMRQFLAEAEQLGATGHINDAPE